HAREVQAAKQASLEAVDATLATANEHLGAAQRQRDDYALRLEQLRAQAENVAIRQELASAIPMLPAGEHPELEEVEATFARLERDLAIQSRTLDHGATPRTVATADREAVLERVDRLLATP
ncbi:MAG: hypothetical protein ACOCXJ_09815, partial [Planctomycetota bacterium]